MKSDMEPSWTSTRAKRKPVLGRQLEACCAQSSWVGIGYNGVSGLIRRGICVEKRPWGAVPGLSHILLAGVKSQADTEA